MTTVQCQRLQSAWEIIRDYKSAIEVLERDLARLASTTDLRFFNTGNCEGTVSIDSKSPLLDDIKNAADQMIRARISEIQKRINTFPAGYIEHGDKPQPIGGAK